MFCLGDLMAGDKTRHQEKWVKAVVGLVTKFWKGRSFVGFFFFLSMTEGLSWWTRINQGVCVGWLLHATFGSNSVFSCDSVTCVWHRQPKGHPPVSAEHHLLMFSLSLSILTLFVFTLLPQHVATSYRLDWETQRRETEPRGFNGLCRRSKEDRARKNEEKATQWLGKGNKQTGR